jgi:hypothetical protein
VTKRGHSGRRKVYVFKDNFKTILLPFKYHNWFKSTLKGDFKKKRDFNLIFVEAGTRTRANVWVTIDET